MGSDPKIAINLNTLYHLLPLHGPRLAAGRLLPLLERGRKERAVDAWIAHVTGARMVLAEAGVSGPVADAVIALLTAETRREISAAKARKTARPSAEIVRFRPRAAGGGQ